MGVFAEQAFHSPARTGPAQEGFGLKGVDVHSHLTAQLGQGHFAASGWMRNTKTPRPVSRCVSSQLSSQDSYPKGAQQEGMCYTHTVTPGTDILGCTPNRGVHPSTPNPPWGAHLHPSRHPQTPAEQNYPLAGDQGSFSF